VLHIAPPHFANRMYRVTCISFCLAAVAPIACLASLTETDVASVLQSVLQVETVPRDGEELDSNDDVVSNDETGETPTFGVLLTTYNTAEREAMYTKRLQWWLRETKLPIFVVDSAGRGFPQSLSKIRNFKQLTFNQEDILGDYVDSTIGELLSLKRAWQTFKNDWSRFDYVVKVTGKYVLPDLQIEMQKVTKGNSFIIEHFTDHPDAGYLRWVNTEFLGFNVAQMGKLLDTLGRSSGALEDRLGRMLITDQYPLQQLDGMMIPAKYQTQRAIGDVLTAVLQTSDKVKSHASPDVP